MRVAPTSPLWVEQGIENHVRQAMLEKRRGLRRFGLDGYEKMFNVTLKSETLGIHGIVDGILKGESDIHVLEFKPSAESVPPAYWIQATGYGLIAAEHFGLPLQGIHILCGKKGKTVSRIGNELATAIDAARRVIAEIRECIECGLMPASSASDAKCIQCEFVNFCNDRNLVYELE